MAKPVYKESTALKAAAMTPEEIDRHVEAFCWLNGITPDSDFPARTIVPAYLAHWLKDRHSTRA